MNNLQAITPQMFKIMSQKWQFARKFKNILMQPDLQIQPDLRLYSEEVVSLVFIMSLFILILWILKDHLWLLTTKESGIIPAADGSSGGAGSADTAKPTKIPAAS